MSDIADEIEKLRRDYKRVRDLAVKLDEQNDRLDEQNDRLEAEAERLRAGIEAFLTGEADIPIFRIAKGDKCPHGRFKWEGCESCVDNYFEELIKEQTHV